MKLQRNLHNNNNLEVTDNECSHNLLWGVTHWGGFQRPTSDIHIPATMTTPALISPSREEEALAKSLPWKKSLSSSSSSPWPEPFAGVLYLAAVILGTDVRKQMHRYMINNMMAIVSSVWTPWKNNKDFDHFSASLSKSFSCVTINSLYCFRLCTCNEPLEVKEEDVVAVPSLQPRPFQDCPLCSLCACSFPTGRLAVHLPCKE